MERTLGAVIFSDIAEMLPRFYQSGTLRLALYHLFSEYLKEHEKKPESLLGPSIAFIVGVSGLAVLSPYAAAIAFPAGLTALIWASVRAKRKAAEVRYLGRGETSEWYAMLFRFRRERQLESRSHPELIVELESSAKLRHEILRTLESSQWKELAAAQGWSTVAGLCRDVAEDLMTDAVWASRPLFRALGARRDTFDRRCADPEYSAGPLAAVKLARAQLERLIEDVSDFPLASMRSTDALARAQLELNSIKDAEREIQGLG